MNDPSLLRFRAVVQGALAHLETRRQEINDLNVFPVADGDTGDNMVLTLQAVLDELDRLGGLDTAVDEIGREQIVDSVARAALLGARGNSGVILSQLIRGAAEELISRPGELVDPTLIGAAMARAAQRAYDSVRAPAEGTMLTVMREMAASIALDLAHIPDVRLSPDGDPETQNALLADVLEHAVHAGEASVKRGPDLLPVLKAAGVVDAGGHAVTILFAGVVAALRGTTPLEIERFAPAAGPSVPQHESSTFRFCTNFAVTGSDLCAGDHVEALEALGDSVLVVGDSATLKVHVHTNDPEAATSVFDGCGAVSRLDVADMHRQVVERASRLDAVPVEDLLCGAVAVVAGDGVAALFASQQGVSYLDGGATLNPSTYELLGAIHASAAQQVVVLPSSRNVIMAAERAADLSEKTVVVVQEADSLQASLAAATAFEPRRDAATNADAMRAAARAIRTGAVAPAGREDPEGRWGIGDAVGFVGDELIAWGDPALALEGVVGALADGAELISLLEGDGAPLAEADVRRVVDAHDGVELEFTQGGQPSYWWLLSAE